METVFIVVMLCFYDMILYRITKTCDNDMFRVYIYFLNSSINVVLM